VNVPKISKTCQINFSNSNFEDRNGGFKTSEKENGPEWAKDKSP
jgi:hypothetical protein